jgi:hypothetical protein
MSLTCDYSSPRSDGHAVSQVTCARVQVPLGHEPFGHDAMLPVLRLTRPKRACRFCAAGSWLVGWAGSFRLSGSGRAWRAIDGLAGLCRRYCLRGRADQPLGGGSLRRRGAGRGHRPVRRDGPATPTTAPAVVHRMNPSAAVTGHHRSQKSWSARSRYYAQLVGLGPATPHLRSVLSRWNDGRAV